MVFKKIQVSWLWRLVALLVVLDFDKYRRIAATKSPNFARKPAARVSQTVWPSHISLMIAAAA